MRVHCITKFETNRAIIEALAGSGWAAGRPKGVFPSKLHARVKSYGTQTARVNSQTNISARMTPTWQAAGQSGGTKGTDTAPRDY